VQAIRMKRLSGEKGKNNGRRTR
jgi:hypothetical protein